MDNMIPILRQCAIFNGISDAETAHLVSCMDTRRVTYPKGRLIWMTGDTVDRCGVILRGAVRTESIGYGGDRTVIASYKAGGIFGDVVMTAASSKSPVDVVAMEDTEVLFLPLGRMMASCECCCGCHEKLRTNLLAEISRKFWQLQDKIRYVSEKSLRARVAMYLLDCRRDSGADTFSVSLNRQELAEFLGANRSALSRELGRMRDEGLISFYRDTFKLHDVPALCAVFGGAL